MSKTSFLFLPLFCLLIGPIAGQKAGKLKSMIKQLNDKVDQLTTQQVQLQEELKATQESAKCTSEQYRSSWTLKRTKITFPDLEKLSLHQETPTYVETLPVPLPNNTRAIIVQVFCNFRNEDGHAYLNVDMQQDGNEEGGIVSVENTHFRVYANTFYYEVMVPWDNSISDRIRFAVTNSYTTEGPNNWYRLRVVGYILA